MSSGDFVPAGGTGAVIAWVEELGKPEPGHVLWDSLVEDLRLALVQVWMMSRGYAVVTDRATEAARLAVGDESAEFQEMLQDTIGHWREVYADLEGKPALIDITDIVGMDMELVVVTADEHAGYYAAGAQIPVHSFITQLVDQRWKICALGRRLAVPGWPPTQTAVTRPSGFGPE